MTDKLYYLFYKEIKTKRKNDQSFFNSYIGFSFLEYTNLASIFATLNYFMKFNFSKDASIYGGLLGFAGIMLYNYFIIWLRKELIVDSYEKIKVKNGKVIIWTYVLLTFIIFFLVLEYFI
jgi:hypothetical protein